VQVSLWNTGEDAYQHERFGDFLTVERVIKLSGAQQNPSTKWKLLDHAGRKVSDSKKAIDDLLDHLNINAGNPLAVMTQASPGRTPACAAPGRIMGAVHPATCNSMLQACHSA
jgi:hypothetical protein